jgi:hypothetical protein
MSSSDVAAERMTPTELYRFDTQGFLVVPGALSPEEVASLNAAVDANQDKVGEPEADERSPALSGGPKYRIMGGLFEWPQPWCRPFRGLIAHRNSVRYLDALLGRGWRLDHPGEYFQVPPGGAGTGFHLGEYFSVDGTYYHYRAGQIRCGLTVFQWVLADQGGERGGFCCIPGSHKSNFPRPTEISRYEAEQDLVVCPEVKAGDLIIFTESLTHGALPWRAEHERRAVLFRYTPRHVEFWSGAFHTYRPHEWVNELDDAARAAVEPPRIHDRRYVNADGTTEEGGTDFFGNVPPFHYDGSQPFSYRREG